MRVHFELEKTLSYKSVWARRFFPTPVLELGRIGALLGLSLATLSFITGLQDSSEIGIFFAKIFSPRVLGASLILFSLGAFSEMWRLFIVFLEDHQPPAHLKKSLHLIEEGKYNLAEWLTYDLFEVMRKANITSKDSTHDLLHMICKGTSASVIFSRLGLSLEEFQQYLQKTDPDETTGTVLWEAAHLAIKHGHEKIGVGDAVSALAKFNSSFKSFLFQYDLDETDVENVAQWYETVKNREERKGKFWLYENLMRVQGIGKGWASGYTINLDKFSRDLTQEIEKGRGFELKLIGHDDEIKQIELILAQAGENNALIIGDPGSGRKTVVYGLAKMIYQGDVLPQIEFKRVIELDLNALLAGAENVSIMQERLITIFNEAVKAKNIILVIDEFENFIGKTFTLGKIDISGILSQYLSSKHFQVIGISNFDGFHRYLEPNSVIMRSFEKVEVKEPTINETIMILEDTAMALEESHRVVVSYQALRDIVKKAEQYIQDVAMPEKAIELLDETVVLVSSEGKEKVVLPHHVDRVLTQRTGIPIGKMAEREKDKLLHLEQTLHETLIDQEEAVNTIASAMRRARTGLGSSKRPIGSFLFLGPTGTGKTETAKALARAYFEKDTNMIRFDMSEFQQIRDITRLLGSFETQEPGVLASKIREEPFSLLLFDEVEKAHPDILNLFLQILDEGFFTDAFGKRVNCRNTIIIATSNAGSNLIRESIEAGIDISTLKEKIIDFTQSEGLFRPEFLNRFDAIVIFKPLSKEHLIEIARLMLEDLGKRLAEKDLTLEITQELKERVVELGYHPEFGARQMRRVVQDKI